VATVQSSASELIGRDRELDALDRLLEQAQSGEGAVLVLHGEPGVGKTALLEQVATTAKAFRVIRTAGVEAEMELPFAALQQLCSPLLNLLDRLPVPQQEALGVAFGLSEGSAPNPYLVALAALGLISEAAEEQPLLCVVDDAQWLDRASRRALGFVARRLLAERIVLTFAAREIPDSLAELPALAIEPLSHTDARSLLESALSARLDESILERLTVEARGNPLALLEMPRGLSPIQLAGGFGLPVAMPLSSQIEKNFERRLAGLPEDSRRLLLLAAADPVGDPALVLRAAGSLGISASAAAPAEAEGLLSFRTGVAFRHPLVRSAVYQAADAEERSEVHRALAEATNPRIDPDRRAWHRAQAATAPDEEVAEELELSAVRAQARGGLSAAAAFLERSVTLTPTAPLRARRALKAAQTKFEAGAVDDALALLTMAETGKLGDLDRARIALLHAQIAFVSKRGNDATPLLLDAARALAGLDPALARETYFDALSAAMFAGRLAGPGEGPPDVAQAAKAAPHLQVPNARDVLLDGLVAVQADGYEAAAPILRQARDGSDRGMSVSEQLRWLWGATVAAVHLWDDTSWERLSERHIALARDTGALGELPLALAHRSVLHSFAGELAAASWLVEESDRATDATGNSLTPYGAVAVVALRGVEDEAGEYIDRMREEVTVRGEGIAVTMLDWGEAVLYNGLSRYEQALAAASRPFEHPGDLAVPNWVLAEMVEAAARSGAPDLAEPPLRRLSLMARVAGTDWVQGVLARSQALLAEDDRAEQLYREAIERLGRTGIAVDLARARLLYGEWLRRRRRRLDAREELRAAHESFSAFGMEAFAARARIELQATGERARRRSADTLSELTPQEAQVSRLAALGSTNREIAAQLFISPSTVGYHLRKAYRKLGVKSRTELAARLR
jgi:DNA-binding CsgD family transcriptional regulator